MNLILTTEIRALRNAHTSIHSYKGVSYCRHIHSSDKHAVVYHTRQALSMEKKNEIGENKTKARKAIMIVDKWVGLHRGRGGTVRGETPVPIQKISQHSNWTGDNLVNQQCQCCDVIMVQLTSNDIKRYHVKFNMVKS